MLVTDQIPAEVRIEYESTLESVDAAEDLVLRTARQMGFDEDQQHDICLSLRECMVNAVVHGNRYNGRKKVHFALIHSPGRMEIVVGDEGEGFDAKQVPNPLAEENLLRQSGRGVMMMQAFMDEFHTGPRAPSGTEVRMVKYKQES
jgi:serine/threonine-protein kinase RsbW